MRNVAVLLLAVGFFMVANVTVDALAASGTETEFVTLINQSRTAAGLNPLTPNESLAAFARTHSADMQESGGIFHSTNLASAATGWESLAENVGVGPSVSSVHSAFMGSSGHRANILGNYNQVGVGVTQDNGQIWVTVIFMRKAQPPVTTTTTLPAATTTPPAVTVTSPTTRQATDKSATFRAMLAGYLAVRQAIKEQSCP